MLDAKAIKEFVEKELEGSDLFLVDVSVKPDNQIEVEIDSDTPVSIEECERLTRAIEQEFDRDQEDYTLEVGSAGLTSPFKVKRQYRKYIGHEVEVLKKDGKKLSGILKDAGEDTFTVTVKEKVKKPESKRPIIEDVDHVLGYDEVKQTKYILKF
ncbi:MAG: ribosome assembly cofactor RimP [Muribaculaceae bacterium]|nr:ribosome assembly cofactor RimP [Muribaculaceae bacterium]